jgi:hypothetical protein
LSLENITISLIWNNAADLATYPAKYVFSSSDYALSIMEEGITIEIVNPLLLFL